MVVVVVMVVNAVASLIMDVCMHVFKYVCMCMFDGRLIVCLFVCVCKFVCARTCVCLCVRVYVCGFD